MKKNVANFEISYISKCKVLVNAGAELNAKDKVGTALFWARRNTFRECIRLLADAGGKSLNI